MLRRRRFLGLSFGYRAWLRSIEARILAVIKPLALWEQLRCACGFATFDAAQVFRRHCAFSAWYRFPTFVATVELELG